MRMAPSMSTRTSLLALAFSSFQAVSEGSFVLYSGQDLTNFAAVKGVSTSCMTAL